MTARSPMLQDLFDYGDWANLKLLNLCQGLSDAQLDLEAPIGLGSLRKVWFHLLEGERLWLARFQGEPDREIQTDPKGLSLDALADSLKQVANERNQLIRSETVDGFRRIVPYRNSKQMAFRHVLGDLLLHVANHGVHHRAQLLNYLRQHERTIPAGIDYLFWKLARPSCELALESLESIREMGLEAGTAAGTCPAWSETLTPRFFAYHEWAMQQVLAATKDLPSSALDQSFDMGLGTLRKTLQHMINVETWWLSNVDDAPIAFPEANPDESVLEMEQRWLTLTAQHRRIEHSLDDTAAQRIVSVTVRGVPLQFRALELLLHLNCHGTHHRAQCLNFLRRLGRTSPPIDLVVWLRQTTETIS